jgi:hypothetical protein
MLTKYDIIVCGSFIQNVDYANMLIPHRNKIIFNITEPIQFFYKLAYQMYTSNFFMLTVGCNPENGKHVKYPHYFDWGMTEDKIKECNKYVADIEYSQIVNKKFASLINRHDQGNTRVPVYNLLKHIGGGIDCPGKLLNNYPNHVMEKKGRTEFQREYIFSICPENFITELDGYITEKIFMAVYAGCIPIYYGKLDDIDFKIFNKERILWYDPASADSMKKLRDKVQYLMDNKDKLVEFYKQPIFCDSAIEMYHAIKRNVDIRVNKFISRDGDYVSSTLM